MTNTETKRIFTKPLGFKSITKHIWYKGSSAFVKEKNKKIKNKDAYHLSITRAIRMYDLKKMDSLCSMTAITLIWNRSHCWCSISTVTKPSSSPLKYVTLQIKVHAGMLMLDFGSCLIGNHEPQ